MVRGGVWLLLGFLGTRNGVGGRDQLQGVPLSSHGPRRPRAVSRAPRQSGPE